MEQGGADRCVRLAGRKNVCVRTDRYARLSRILRTELTKHVGDPGIQAGGRLGSRQGGRIVALVPFWYGVEA